MKRYFISITILVSVLASSCYTTDKDNVSKQGEDKLPPLTEQEKVILEKIGGEVLPDKNLKIGSIIIHRRENELSFPAKMCVTDGGEYVIEVLISLPHGLTHEALMVTETDPVRLQLALYLIGAENGATIPVPGVTKQGTRINIDVKPEGGERTPVEEWLYDMNKEEFLPRSMWVFVGSSFQNGKCLAKEEGNVVNFLRRGNAILDNCSEIVDLDRGLGVNESMVPQSGTPVTVYFSIAGKDDQALDYTQ